MGFYCVLVFAVFSCILNLTFLMLFFCFVLCEECDKKSFTFKSPEKQEEVCHGGNWIGYIW